MEDPQIIYEIFNRIEGIAWWIIAVVLPFVVKYPTRRQHWAVFAASLGFILFGISDFLEAPVHGQLPWWLWALKVFCAAWLLACRFFYVGWHRFRLTDRYVLFAIFCLFAVFGVMVLQHYLYGS